VIILAPTVLAKIISLWADYGIPNNLREFNFKFFNNYLAINTRLSHFVADQTRNCTFCTLANTVGEETFPHLFYYCPIVRALQSSFEAEFFDNRVTGINSQKFWFTGLIEDDKFNFFLAITAMAFNFVLWNFKIRKKNPVFYNFKLNFFSLVKKISLTCTNFFFDLNNYDFIICREFRQLSERHGDG